MMYNLQPFAIHFTKNCGTKFFLIAPELHCLSSQANDLANLKSSTPTKHHTFTNVVTNRQQKYVLKLLTALNTFTNPFKYDGDDLINLVTKSVMSNVVKDDVCNHANVGKDLYQKFCETRIISKSVNLWDPMKKVKLQTFKSASKIIKVKVKDEIVELKEDRGLFARMLIVTRSRPDIDLKRCISLYELTVVPRSLFSPDGMLLLCSTKSIILKQLETLLSISTHSENEVVNTSYLIDGMAELQGLDKPKSVSTVLELSDHFIARFYTKYNRYDEVHLIFDDYTISNSLKTATRKKRLGQSVSVHYKIDDSSKIQHLIMKRLLSHVQTKDELTVYLADKIFDYALSEENDIVVAYRQNVCYTTGNNYEASSHEEADTKIIFHALAVSNYGVSKLDIYSPDTDVLILLLRRYTDLAKNTSFVIGAGRILQLGPIFHAIGPIKIAARPGFHAFSGADVTGSFAGKGKGKCWKTFGRGGCYTISN